MILRTYTIWTAYSRNVRGLSKVWLFWIVYYFNHGMIILILCFFILPYICALTSLYAYSALYNIDISTWVDMLHLWNVIGTQRELGCLLENGWGRFMLECRLWILVVIVCLSDQYLSLWVWLRSEQCCELMVLIGVHLLLFIKVLACWSMLINSNLDMFSKPFLGILDLLS